MCFRKSIAWQAPRPSKPPPSLRLDPKTCPKCGARFDKLMKFCGECGEAMPAASGGSK